MSHWSFVAAAYAIAIAATGALVLWALVSARRAEAALDDPPAR